MLKIIRYKSFRDPNLPNSMHFAYFLLESLSYQLDKSVAQLPKTEIRMQLFKGIISRDQCSGSVCFWASRIRIRIRNYLYWSGHKINQKCYCCWLLNDTLSLKTNVNVYRYPYQNARNRNIARDEYLYKVLKNQQILTFCMGSDGVKIVFCLFCENFNTSKFITEQPNCGEK